ncbi:hypothetical protein A0H81_14423 [Grifola frondosa]|uniref:Uncharacterized protein n=1 Tax=Grifola frondosa TaxID=5627 RepID=A0A1C7LS66_GRIFR|nr:hypothetical protein A0H81_14423 [Grifola frondosa]
MYLDSLHTPALNFSLNTHPTQFSALPATIFIIILATLPCHIMCALTPFIGPSRLRKDTIPVRRRCTDTLLLSMEASRSSNVIKNSSDHQKYQKISYASLRKCARNEIWRRRHPNFLDACGDVGVNFRDGRRRTVIVSVCEGTKSAGKDDAGSGEEGFELHCDWKRRCECTSKAYSARNLYALPPPSHMPANVFTQRSPDVVFCWCKNRT